MYKNAFLLTEIFLLCIRFMGVVTSLSRILSHSEDGKRILMSTYVCTYIFIYVFVCVGTRFFVSLSACQ
jgi:hypothetical protein